MPNPVLTLESGAQRLELAPQMGGSVTAWDWNAGNEWMPLFRRWNGQSEDRYTVACFPLVPWSNRITGGGFDSGGVFYPIRPNRAQEPYPIHGDGWLQPWQVTAQTNSGATLAIESHRYDGNPYDYRATQDFRLLPDGLAIDLTVTHLGERPLPYGLGLHPYFMRNSQTRLRSRATGVWLSGSDAIPVEHVQTFLPTWDYNQPAPLEGPMIDNCFTGWDGEAVISYPDRGWTLTMRMADCNGYSLMYRPPGFDYFCLEPITHPIDAFHTPGCPGLVMLSSGQSFSLKTSFTVAPLS